MSERITLSMTPFHQVQTKPRRIVWQQKVGDQMIKTRENVSNIKTQGRLLWGGGTCRHCLLLDRGRGMERRAENAGDCRGTRRWGQGKREPELGSGPHPPLLQAHRLPSCLTAHPTSTQLFLLPHVPCCCLKHLKWDQLLQLT